MSTNWTRQTPLLHFFSTIGLCVLEKISMCGKSWFEIWERCHVSPSIDWNMHKIHNVTLKKHHFNTKRAYHLQYNTTSFALIYALQGWYSHLHLAPKGHFTHETESPWPLHFTHSHWWKRRSRSKFASHSAWGTNGVCECKMDVKSAWMDSYMASNGSCFMVTWTIFKNHLLEVGRTQNQETMALRMLPTVDLFYCTMCEDPHEQKSIDVASGWGPGHIWASHYTWGSARPYYMMLEVCWDGLWTLSFWALTISWSRFSARVWSGPKLRNVNKEILSQVAFKGENKRVPSQHVYHMWVAQKTCDFVS